MKDFKKVLLKLLLVVLLLVSLNYVYKYFFYDGDLKEHSEVFFRVNTPENLNADILYLGESSNVTFRGDDYDKRPISGFLQDYFPSIKIGEITKEAAHAGIFLALLKSLPEPNKVKTVVFTMNIRSFDCGWIYSNLETPLQKSLVLLRPYPPLVNRMMLSFKDYEIKTELERDWQIHSRWKRDTFNLSYPFPYKDVIDWDSMTSKKGILNPDGSRNQGLTELACNYIKTYGFQIDTLNNPRIQDFDEVVEYAHERGWNLVFNLLAENTKRAKELVGEDLVYIIRKNRDILVNRYSKNGVIVVDNLEDVPNEEFIDQNWTTEHYAEIGRRKIASNVAKALKKFYPKEYNSNVSISFVKLSQFYNDCEGKIIWGQKQTLTNEKSFSGKSSSKFGNDNVFSLTFEYAIKNLPDTIKFVDVECKYFQTTQNKSSRFVMEIEGKNIEHTRAEYQLSEENFPSGKWVSAKHTFPLDSTFFKGDIVKLFLVNQDQSFVYLDDIQITFRK
jgi:hypothetical protein